MTESKRQLRVFLCHASVDKPKVRELYHYLKRRGIQPWLDAEDLIPGQNWRVEIPKALDSSDAIVICLTKNSVDKEGYVQKEIKFALDKALEMPEGRIFLIPARLEDCEVPYSLNDYQWVDLFEGDGYSRLMRALKMRVLQLQRADLISISQPALVKPEPGEIAASLAQEAEVGKQLIEVHKKPRPVEAQKPEVKKAGPNLNTLITVAVIALASIIFMALVVPTLIEKWFSPSPIISTATETATISVAQIIDTQGSSAVTTNVTATQPASSIPTSTKTHIPTSTTTPLPTGITDAQGVEMIFVPAGKFVMGIGTSPDVGPEHTVYLDSYYIDKYEVTNALYKVCVVSGACRPPNQKSSETRPDYYDDVAFDNYPVVNVDWSMARIYCEWRGARLPTEAEWEKAARGTDGRSYPWGEGVDCDRANYLECNLGDTTEVGQYEGGVSPYGVYDMAGNAYEWVADWYLDTYYSVSPDTNPTGPETGDHRVTRGGAYNFTQGNNATYMRDYWNMPSYYWNYLGFRCAKDANP